MSTPVISAPSKKPLAPGRDIDIIACERPMERRCIGVRWASAPHLGFPPSGYRVSRAGLGKAGDLSSPIVLGTFRLPASHSWAAFEQDALARQPACGPYFDHIREETHGFLLPLVRLVDPGTPASEDEAGVIQACAFFGPVHESDAELTWKLWRQAVPPPLPDLLADPAARDLVIRFYRQTTVEFLHALALRFEYAALLGLGTSDGHAVESGTVSYVVEAAWPAVSGAARSESVTLGQRCEPAAPARLRAERLPGSVPHPLFAVWPAWTAPAALAPTDGNGVPMPLRAPRGPATFTALEWSAPPAQDKLLGHHPVLYEVSRHAFGAASAALLAAPAVPANATFTALVPGDLVVRSRQAPHFTDLPGMDWPALEGWYAYQVRGVDLLGVRSAPAPLALIRHHDDLPPPPPPATLLDTRAVSVDAGQDVRLSLRITWDAAQDFNAPDTTEFRVAATWVPMIGVGVQVHSSQEVDTLHAELSVSGLAAPANQYVGLSLSLPGSDFPIVSHGNGAPADVRVRKRREALPAAPADGVIHAPGTPTPLTRVARLARRPAVAATLRRVNSTTPLEFLADAATATPLPADARLRLYVHALRLCLDAEHLGAGRYRLAEPEAGTAAAQSLARWRALPGAAALLEGSPLMLFPHHPLALALTPPIGWVSGMLVLGVSAADDSGYVESPVLPVASPALAGARGNESTRSELTVSVRSTAAPPAVTVPPWDPNQRWWATTAASFAETASATLSWPTTPGAARYEVWRAPEAALPGVTALTPDDELRRIAAATPAAFELRSDQVFGTRHVDELPGRAPMRAVYKVRAVSLAAVPGAWSDLIGPIHVPDIRSPAAPNLLRVAPARQDEADRALVLEWGLSGPRDDIRFDILARAATDSAPFSPVGSVPRGTAPASPGRWRWLHTGCTPGMKMSYRLVAVREALDPVDPAAQRRRDIAGPPSQELSGTAIAFGPLLPPDALSAAADGATGNVRLSWVNGDIYQSIEVWRRDASDPRYVRVGSLLPGSATSVQDSPGSGTWRYQVRAFGIRRDARSPAEAEISLP